MDLVPWADGPQFWIWRAHEYAARTRRDFYAEMIWVCRVIWERHMAQFSPAIGMLFPYPGRY